MEISNNFDTFGLPAGVKATKGTTLQHLGYVFDPKTGNMTSRSDQRRNITETFEYDNLDRLLSCSTMGNDTYTEYSANGNIKSTNSMGEYRYGISSKPYAVSGIENIANAVPNHTQTISYTSFKRPQQITQNNNSLTYTYNSAGYRAKSVAVENGSTTTTYTFGGGYTGHAHLPRYGLINMNTCVKRVQCTNLFVAMPSVASVGVANARLYDPLLCRFLSPDPYVNNSDNLFEYRTIK